MARVSGGNLSYARELVTSESARRERNLLLDVARDIPAAGLMDTQVALDDLMASVDARAAEQASGADAELEQALEWAGDARTRAWLKKRHEEKIKRRQRRAHTQGLHTVTRVFAGWYRDLALVAAGAGEAVLNQDRLDDLQRLADPKASPGLYQRDFSRRKGRGAASV